MVRFISSLLLRIVYLFSFYLFRFNHLIGKLGRFASGLATEHHIASLART
ncbi:MAG: hypothetical protein ACI82H_002082 [Alphaproteobacteria bacterium]